MLAQIRPALVVLLLLTLITGLAYPLAVTGIAQVVFPHQANGSVIVKDGAPAGSELIGQNFDDPRYFWGRLSATTPVPYAPFFKDTAGNLTGSTGTNYGPLNPALFDAVKARVAALQATDPNNHAPVPVDLATASASGLDPDISPAAAYYQVHRVAKARGLFDSLVRNLVAAHIQGRQLGVLGEPRVNVLQLNLALDQLAR